MPSGCVYISDQRRQASPTVGVYIKGVNSWNMLVNCISRITGDDSYFYVLSQETVEEVDVCCAEVSEILVFLNWGGLHCQKLEASLCLYLVALDDWGSQTIGPKVFANFGGV